MGMQGRVREVPSVRAKRAVAAVWVAATMTVMVGFAALAVDVGYIYSTQAELQRTADAAAMAAASRLAGSELETTAFDIARHYSQLNEAGGVAIDLSEDDITLGRAVMDSGGKYAFEPGAEPPDAVRIRVRRSSDSPNGALQLFLGPFLGVSEADLGASATAMLVPRDIVIVMDLSNSMSYDSQLKHESETEINIRQVWEDLGSPTFGKMTAFHSSASQMPYYSSSLYTSKIKSYLGLTNVPYPYPQGSWDEYINYVKTSLDDSWRDADERAYEDRYGLRTFVHYLLDKRHCEWETPELSNTRVQPVHALKQAIGVLCQYLVSIDSSDQVGLVSYCDTSRIEHELTYDLEAIAVEAYSQQAGSYGSQTNIASGVDLAVAELLGPRARPTAKKVMILMTDGMANRPDNEEIAREVCIESATGTGANRIQIFTISLGSVADQELMAELAELGKGEHYHVPTLAISQYEEDLRQVFRTLGGRRPVRLIE